MAFARLRPLPDPDHLPALDKAYLSADPARGLGPHDQPPRILLLYGSLRERSYSRFCVEEAARLLQWMGCETRIFDPSDLPLPGRRATMTTRRCANCATMPCGPKAWSGAARSGTVRSRA